VTTWALRIGGAFATLLAAFILLAGQDQWICLGGEGLTSGEHHHDRAGQVRSAWR
jgi:hypothetical protein